MTLPPPAAEPSDPAATAILPRVEDPHPFAPPESEIEARAAEVEAYNLAAAEAARDQREAEEAEEAAEAYAADVIAAARAETPPPAQQPSADGPVVTVEPPPALAPDPSDPAPATAVPEPSEADAGVMEEADVATLSSMLLLVESGCRAAGQPISVAVSAAIRTAQINLPGGSIFTAWCSFFQLAPGSVTVTTDVLGAVAEGSVEMSGWTVVLSWAGPAIEETP